MIKTLFIGTLLLSAFRCAYGNDTAPADTPKHKAGPKAAYAVGSVRSDAQAKPSLLSGAVANIYANTQDKPRLALDISKVQVESDGSYSPKTERTIDVLSALNSSVGAAVNFEIQFAKNSSVLTADGRQTLGLIADAISYLDSAVRIDLEIPKHPSKDRSFTQARGSELVRLLRSRYGVKNPVKLFITPLTSKAGFYSVKTHGKETEIKRVTILNMGLVN